MPQRPRSERQVPELFIGVVGTLNFLDEAVKLCSLAGIEARAYPLNRYGPAIRWLVSRDFRRCTMLYQPGAGGIKYIVAGRLLGRPTIKHWIGSDAHSLADGRGLAHAFKVWILRNWPAYHLAVTQGLAERLAPLGIRTAGIVRYVTESVTIGHLEPLPERFTVLSYWTPGRREFYGGNIVLEAARKMPDVRFRIVGNDGTDEPTAPNVEYLGYRKDMPTVFSQATVLVRLPRTDGAPNMPLEMLVRGRYVIYNEPLDGCILARSVEEVCRALADLRDETLPNADGARLVREQFSPENEAAIFRHCLEQYLGRALPSGRGPASARTTNPDARR